MTYPLMHYSVAIRIKIAWSIIFEAFYFFASISLHTRPTHAGLMELILFTHIKMYENYVLR